MLDTKAQWIYYPNPELSYHRILVRHNFCPNSKGYWTETNLTRYDEDKANKEGKTYFVNDYAYPLNTIGKQESMQKILSWAKEKEIHRNCSVDVLPSAPIHVFLFLLPMKESFA